MLAHPVQIETIPETTLVAPRTHETFVTLTANGILQFTRPGRVPLRNTVPMRDLCVSYPMVIVGVEFCVMYNL